MKFIRERVLKQEFMAGAWCNLGSPITVEMAARADFDWILIDQEHGPGDNMTLLHQIQAAEAGSAPIIVRIAWNEMPRFKRVLDLGAAGVMVPYVQTPQEAADVVSFMRYPPEGVRGVASTPRAAGFGHDFSEYFDAANRSLLTVVQIETARAVKNLEAIASVPGVDVLFVGPLDLSISLQKPGRFKDPDFIEVLKHISSVVKSTGKAAGMFLPGLPELPLAVELGFTFVAVCTDGGIVTSGMKDSITAVNKYRH
ncbi:MAG TPA: 2,4-dihydroxyhept-2-ene-1,7-dioic acid aldolase [Desulfobacteraceae bacterium]|nr:2,4-dihydroxyhept-2-ene-1,7-dioic acid aldolase [Desulfobacteraceae bacterium]